MRGREIRPDISLEYYKLIGQNSLGTRGREITPVISLEYCKLIGQNSLSMV